MWFARDRNAVGIIALRYSRGRCRCGGWRAFLSGRILRRRSSVGIERLLSRRVLDLALHRIPRYALAHLLRRLIHIGTGCEKKSSKQQERQREFHKVKYDEVNYLLIQCQLLNGVAARSTINFKIRPRLFQRQRLCHSKALRSRPA
jgi:hypothetical protein